MFKGDVSLILEENRVLRGTEFGEGDSARAGVAGM